MLRTCVLWGILAGCVFGQSVSQTLPNGYLSTDGGSASAWPINTTADQIWQWHYDASEFSVQAPITITALAIRPSSPVGLPAFSFSNFTVTLMEASRDYASGSSTLHENILRSKVCRSGPWSGGPAIPLPAATLGAFFPIGLTESFTYDPSSGNDFIIQIEKCGATTTWGTSLDMVSGTLGTMGGVRRGHTTDCASTTQDNGPAAGFGTVPVVRISYHHAWQTLPRGYDTVDGNSSQVAPISNASAQKWHWHYDSGQFDAQGPIAIRQIWVRAAAPGSAVGAFSFANFDVTLATARSDYIEVSRFPSFDENIDNQKLVRTGPWSSGPTPASGLATATWVPLGLTESFVYDPSLGQDLIVQIERCGASVPWSTHIDGTLGVSAVGGNRYGNAQSCDALYVTTSSGFESVPIIRIDYEPLSQGAGAVTAFPWREDFDGFSSHGFENVESEALNGFGDWIRQSGPTWTVGTGPTGDHTTGLGIYAYVEDSLSENPAVSLLSPPFDFSNLAHPTVSFWVHSLNVGVENTLSLDVIPMPPGPIVEDVMTPVGSLGTLWTERTVDLSAFAGQTVRLRFRVNTQNGHFAHDIAIDDLRVYEPTPQAGQSPQATATLDVSRALTPNGVPVTLGVSGPYATSLHFGESVDITITGEPAQPILLWSAPLNVGITAFPGIGQLDVGLRNLSNVTFVFNGLTGGEMTGATGTFNFTLPSTLPPGLSFPVQGAVLSVGPFGAALTNAVIVNSL